MAILIDTSILGRLANRADVSHPVAKAAIAELHRRGEVLHVTRRISSSSATSRRGPSAPTA